MFNYDDVIVNQQNDLSDQHTHSYYIKPPRF